MMRWIALVLLVCGAVAGQDRSGEYAAQIPEVATGLLLKPDGKFEYYFVYGAADYMAQGTWKSEAGAVVLNTEVNGAPPFRLLRSAAGSAEEVRVHVQGPNGGGVQHMDVILTTDAGTEQARTEQDGVARLEGKGKLASIAIHIPVYDVNGGPFAVSGGREFWIEINGEAITRVPFRNERLKVTEKGLELAYWNAEKPITYRKAK